MASITIKITDRFKKYIALIFLATAFGYIEASVVYYLRQILNTNLGYVPISHQILLNLGFITFIQPVHSVLINPYITRVETVREAATIVLLLSVAYIAGSNFRQRFASFLISFAIWDLSYYLFLKIIDNWPTSFFSKDVYFLIPVTWIGPVITPIFASIIIFAIGSRLYLFNKSK